MHLCVNLSCAAKLICALTRLDVHRVVVLEEHDANLAQSPAGKLLDLLRDIGSQGGRADEEPVLPHRLEPVGTWEADLLLAGCFGAAFPLRLSAATA